MDSNLTVASLTKDKRALIECPTCGFQKIINVSKFFNKSNIRKFVYNCKCGNLFGVVLETREHERNYLDIDGIVIYDRKIGHTQQTKIIVKDLSRSGIRFATRQLVPFRVDDGIVIRIQFNDYQKSFFTKEATVRDVKGYVVRAEFKTLCDHIAITSKIDE
jgi:predicted RNA-binding Zn-ribbon protein involved in translation (DUF1610 family)